MRRNIIKKVCALLLAVLLTEIANAALAERLILPDNIEIIEEEAFCGDASIDEVVLGENVKEIRSRAFMDTHLTEINLPNSLSYIADDAFDAPGTSLTVTAESGTYAYIWAVQNGYMAPVLDGKTDAVDSSTTLDDGVYSPSSFTFSGGSGRASISCSKVQVEDGHAYAWLVFDSPNYGYVKANGKKYLGNHTSSTSTFKIPAKLGEENRILGLTTAMAAPMEIEYMIYVDVKTSPRTTPDPYEDDEEDEEEYDPDRLSDGVYSPSAFSVYSGDGNGNISCSKVQVEDGEPYAWLVFDSPNYGYIKTNGKKYLGMHTSSTSAFKIPVVLGEIKSIIAMTTEMETPTEIEYFIYVDIRTSR